jgi:23S rRNA (adenine2503-C2)-methyltransferase
MESKTPLLGMTLGELKGVAAQTELPVYAAGQMADWLYRKRVTSIAGMTNLAAAKRSLLEKTYDVGAFPPVTSATSSDGTIKYLFRITPEHAVETVYIPADERATLCVSSQAGCKMKCLFCMTGKQGFAANLTAGQIINQIHSTPGMDTLTNVVFMGMGEPFDNTDELFKVLEILTAPYGYGWSPKRITVSTAGIIKGLKRYLEESTCHLAISLHSPYPEERRALMPVEQAYPAEDVIRLVRQYDFAHQRRISFEYIMFENRNDSTHHAKALARMLKGIPCRVNLIRFHEIPDVPLKSCDTAKMELFRNTLNEKGILCTIRASRGEDILAACGMLSTAGRR